MHVSVRACVHVVVFVRAWVCKSFRARKKRYLPTCCRHCTHFLQVRTMSKINALCGIAERMDSDFLCTLVAASRVSLVPVDCRIGVYGVRIFGLYAYVYVYTYMYM